MKPKIQPEDLEGMKFVDYRKLFFKELKRLQASFPEKGQQNAEFILVTEWEFPDFPGKEIPLMIVGSLNSAWEKFYKLDAKKRKQKDFAMGICGLGDEVQEGQQLNISVQKGRIKPKGERALDKVLLGKMGFVANLLAKGSENETDDDDDNDNTLENKKKIESPQNLVSGVGAANALGGKNGNAGKKIDPQLKEELKQQAKVLNTTLKELKGKFNTVKTEVTKNIKKGVTGAKDMVAINELQSAFKAFNESYTTAHEKLQEKYAAAKKNLEKQNKELAKLALATKAKHKSLAQQLADAFFSKKQDRVANPEEVKQMQKSLKKAIDYRQISLRQGDEKQLNLKAIYITASHKGPGFQGRHTDVVYEKLMAAGI